jgi:hypothetical protein
LISILSPFYRNPSSPITLLFSTFPDEHLAMASGTGHNADGLRRVLGRKAFAASCSPSTLRYFAPSFHSLSLSKEEILSSRTDHEIPPRFSEDSLAAARLLLEDFFNFFNHRLVAGNDGQVEILPQEAQGFQSPKIGAGNE